MHDPARAKIAAVTGRRWGVAVVALALMGLVAGGMANWNDEGGVADDGPQVSANPTEPGPDAGPSDDEGEAPQPDEAADAVIATFNVLGHSHTTTRGKLPEMDPGPGRLRQGLKLLRDAEVSLVAFQELQRPQATEFRRVAGDKWELFHSAADSENALAWRRTTWERVVVRTVGVPYFDGRERQMPVVKLRHIPTGETAWFISVHNPANTPRFPGQEEHREAANRVEAALVKRLARGKAAVVLMGDLNQRQEAFCFFTASGLLHSATGEPRREPCQDPAYDGIDWIFGTTEVAFSGWDVRRDDDVRAASDHPLVTVNLRFQR